MIIRSIDDRDPARMFAYWNSDMLLPEDRATLPPSLFRVVAAESGSRSTIGDVPTTVTVLAIPYLLREIVPESLDAYGQLTVGYNNYYEEDHDGINALSEDHRQFLLENDLLLVKTSEIPDTPSRRWPAEGMSICEPTYPPLPEPALGSNFWANMNEYQRMRATKSIRDLGSESSTEVSDQEQHFPRKA